MSASILALSGGIGLFLFGMQALTDALRQLTSQRARRTLRGLTASPLAGVVTGAGITAVVQSSSAVMVMTIGLVGAGMLTFAQSIGVVLGANIGTTVTGWIVALVGIKLQLGMAALGLMFGAVVLIIFGRGRVERIGRGLAGFSLIFIGLDMMQGATAGVSNWLTPDMLPADTMTGRAVTVLIGVAVTVLIQSSSAGVAMVLVLVSGGTIGFAQGAALVIGMNIGTTSTVLLTGIGGSLAMRRTAVAHLTFNVVTAMLAFAALPWATAFLLWLDGGDPVAALVLFHTAFNVAGVALFLPFVRQFAALVMRVVPGQAGTLDEPLDRSLLRDEGAALDAAHGAARALTGVLMRATARRLTGGAPDRHQAAQVETALRDTEDFLTRITLPEGAPEVRLRYSAMLHQIDHLHRLSHRMYRDQDLTVLRTDPALARPARALAVACLRAAEGGRSADRLARLQRLIAGRSRRYRRSVLLREHAGQVEPGAVFDMTDVLRWLDRSADHVAQIVQYADAALAERPDPPQAGRPPIL